MGKSYEISFLIRFASSKLGGIEKIEASNLFLAPFKNR